MAELVNLIGPAGLSAAIVAMFFGAAAQASIGMGLNLFTVGILALINPVFVPGPILVHSCLLSIVASIRLRRDIAVDELAVSVAGLVAGTVFAAIVLASIPTDNLPRMFGALIVVGVVVTAAGMAIPPKPTTILAASAAAGIMGTLAGTHGPPIALVYQRESPGRIRAALLPFFAVANPISLAGLAAVGLFGWREIQASILLLPGLILGYIAGVMLMPYLNAGFVRTAILLISAASGIALVVKG